MTEQKHLGKLMEPAANAGVVTRIHPREFVSQAGAAISFIDNGGLVLQHVHVQLIFWGFAWASNTLPTIGDVTNAVVSILSGPYMSELNQYRNISPGSLNGVTLAITQIGSSPANPPNPFSDTDVANLTCNLINAGMMPGPASDSQLLYCVIMPPNVSTSSSFIGEHTYFQYAGTNAHYAWVLNNSSLDSLTSIFSHELVEACTDPEGTAILGTPGTCNQPGWCEIGDVCEGNNGVVDGITVQKYWSQRDNACILPMKMGMMNLLDNPSFEDMSNPGPRNAPTGWFANPNQLQEFFYFQTSPSHPTLTNPAAHDGTTYVVMNVAQNQSAGLAQTVVNNIIPGHRYHFQVWLFTQFPIGATASVNIILSSGGNQVDLLYPVKPPDPQASDPWRFFEAEVVAASTELQVNIVLNAGAEANGLGIDDAALTDMGT